MFNFILSWKKNNISVTQNLDVPRIERKFNYTMIFVAYFLKF